VHELVPLGDLVPEGAPRLLLVAERRPAVHAPGGLRLEQVLLRSPRQHLLPVLHPLLGRPVGQSLALVHDKAAVLDGVRDAGRALGLAVEELHVLLLRGGKRFWCFGTRLGLVSDLFGGFFLGLMSDFFETLWDLFGTYFGLLEFIDVQIFCSTGRWVEAGVKGAHAENIEQS
jgi:hypothetical protein